MVDGVSTDVEAEAGGGAGAGLAPCTCCRGIDTDAPGGAGEVGGGLSWRRPWPMDLENLRARPAMTPGGGGEGGRAGGEGGGTSTVHSRAGATERGARQWRVQQQEKKRAKKSHTRHYRGGRAPQRPPLYTLGSGVSQVGSSYARRDAPDGDAQRIAHGLLRSQRGFVEGHSGCGRWRGERRRGGGRESDTKSHRTRARHSHARTGAERGGGGLHAVRVSGASVLGEQVWSVGTWVGEGARGGAHVAAQRHQRAGDCLTGQVGRRGGLPPAEEKKIKQECQLQRG